jgi:hypothetical protein
LVARGGGLLGGSISSILSALLVEGELEHRATLGTIAQEAHPNNQVVLDVNPTFELLAWVVGDALPLMSAGRQE